MAEKIKYYYEKGIYKTSHLQVFLEKGVIDEKLFASLVAEDGENQH